MYSDELGDIIKELFKPLVENEESKIFGLYISDDPYENMSKYKKFLLVEPDESDYQSGNGFVQFETLKTKFSLGIQIENRTHKVYRKELREVKKIIVDHIANSSIGHKLTLVKSYKDEILINNTKYTAEIFEADIKTTWG